MEHPPLASAYPFLGNHALSGRCFIEAPAFFVSVYLCRLARLDDGGREKTEMKKVYVFATGERVTAEISEEWAAVLAEMDRAEHANNEKHRSHRYSLDAVDFEGEEFGIYDAHPFEAEDATAERVRAAFAMLTPTQQRRLKLYARDLTYCEIGRLEGIDAKTCYESIEAGRKKFFKYF